MNAIEKFHKKVVEDSFSGKRVSPLKAIRAFCLECVGFQKAEVKDCMGMDCPLYKFRYGRNMTGRKKV